MSKGDAFARVTLGDSELDSRLDGGLPRGFLTLAVGPSGVGKTALAVGAAKVQAQQARYVLCGGLRPESFCAVHGLARELVADVTWHLLDARLSDELHSLCGHPDLTLLVFDSLDPVFRLQDDGVQRLALARSLGDLAWEHQLAVLGLARQPWPELLDSAVTVIDWLDEGPRLAKSLNQATVPLTSLGRLDDGLSQAILAAFRTTQQLTMVDIVDLVGRDPAAVEQAVRRLETTGELRAVRSAERPTTYHRPGS